MSPIASVADSTPARRAVPDPVQATEAASGLSWGAALAGAVAATALSFILVVLGVGLGLSSVSPWSYRGAEASTLAASAILWVTLTQVLASGLGGYMAGRLRGRWTRLRSPEVFFRDTAHGLVAWSVATLVMAGLMGSALTGVLGQTARTASAVVSTAADAALGSGSLGDPAGYWVDTLLRGDPLAQATPADPAATPLPPAAGGDPAAERMQAARIVLNALRTGALPNEDVRYLAQLVSARTGLPPDQAEQRVRTQFAKAKQTLADAENTAKQKADDARRASAYGALWMFVALLAGAFVAAAMATFGGRQRDAAVLHSSSI
ncbi:hypothetical protein [Aquabacterium olei]|uniref:hypothetical protein n=1 Tax=Aquabacterium olei TaxID=1296669 RepID=UPI001FEBF4AD|nr:hypothetical protein [Aquabacterium olei]